MDFLNEVDFKIFQQSKKALERYEIFSAKTALAAWGARGRGDTPTFAPAPPPSIMYNDSRENEMRMGGC